MKKLIGALCLLCLIINPLFAGNCYRGDATLFAEPDQGMQPIVRAIGLARRDIELVIYTFNSKPIIRALIHAKRRGVAVRVILERQPYKMSTFNHPAYQQLKHAGINIRYSNPAFHFTHEKALIIDHRRAFLMTGNFTPSGFYYQRNFTLIIDSAPLIQQLLSVFQADWSRTKAHTPYNSALIFSPYNSAGRINRFLWHTRQSLDMYVADLTDYHIIDILKNLARHGKTIHIITNANDVRNNARTFKQLRQLGVKVYMRKNLTIHSKAMIRDASTQHPMAYIGSANLTRTSLKYNREAGVMVCNVRVIRELMAVFRSDQRESTSIG